MEEQNIQEINIREALAVLRRRWWVVLLSVVACLIIAGLFTVRAPRVYQATSQIEIKTPNPTPSALMSLTGANPDTFKQTELALITNPSVDEQISAYLSGKGLQVDPGLIGRSLTATDRRNTDLIDLAVRSTDPQLAQAIANAAPWGFRNYTKGVTDEAAVQDLATMNQRVASARDNMDHTSRSLADFQTANHIMDLKDETDETVKRISAMQANLGTVRASLDAAETRIVSLRSQLQQQNDAIDQSGPRNDPLIAELQTKLTELNAQLNHLNETAPGATYQIHPLQDDIRDAQNRLNIELNKVTQSQGNLVQQEKLQEGLALAEQDAASLRTQYDSVTRQLLQANYGIKDLPGKEREFAKLAQSADVARALYQKTLESFQAIDMERLAHPSPISITQAASTPKTPVSPRPLVNLLLGLFAGLGIGLLSALSLEHLDEAVHNEADLRKLAGDLPVLGALPILSGSELANPEDLTPASRGPYRLLWTNIGFSAVDERLRNMVVTSSVQGEGKSLTSAYLARAAAEEGQRVILVDCDLRRPAQHRNFNVQDALGVCEVLAGKVSLDDALVPTDQPNLLLLPAGKTLPLNPAVLFKSERMAQLMDELDRRADFVLYDAPPSLVITDALLIAPHCQGILQVVEADRTSKEHIKKVVGSISRARVRHLGLVLNKVKKTALGYYGYYYYYQGDETPGSNGVRKTRKKKAVEISKN